MIPTSIDGTDITGATIDGTDVQEITVDGQTVFTSGPPAGTHFYNIDNRNDAEVLHYELSTPFDIANKGSTTSTLSLSVNTIEGMALTPSGETIFVVTDPTTAEKFDLSTPFDLSRAGSGTSVTIPGTSAVDATAFTFGDEGNKLYVQGGLNELSQFDLSTPFDPSTSGSKTGSISGFPNNGPGDPAFSPDGTKVVIGERGSSAKITGGECSTPYDIDTFTQTGTFTTSDADPLCCKWNGDGTTLFARHASPNMVNEFSTTTPYSVSGMSFVGAIFTNSGFATDAIDFNY